MTTCPVCGSSVRVVSSDEGTSHYAPDPGAGLREAAQAVLSQAETDDDFEGEFVDYLVPAPALDALRAALAAAPVADTTGIDAAWREALRLVDAAIFDLPIGNDVTYSRGYSAGIAAARESLRESLRAAALRTPKPEGEPE